MAREKVGVKNKELASIMAKYVALLGIATIAPFFGSQPVTGIIVNATLFVATIFIGTRGAVLVAVAPSLIAVSVGTLPPPLAPIIPFIILGNIILILIFGYAYKNGYWRGVISASVAKFIFLYTTTSIMMDLILDKTLSANIAVMMSWPQLFTAIGGGLLAFAFLKSIKKK